MLKITLSRSSFIPELCLNNHSLNHKIISLILTSSQYIFLAENIRQLVENCQQDKLEQFLTTSIEQLK